MQVLVLGGTAHARAVARLLSAHGIEPVTSLAGRTSTPRGVPGQVRTGGFGGPDGLVAWLVSHPVAAVIDATHPFAERMSSSAALGCARAGVPLLRLVRPGWGGRPDAATWRWVDSHEQAADATALVGRRPLLTVGRQGARRYLGRLGDLAVTARVAEIPAAGLDWEVPVAWRILAARGPFELPGELAVLDRYGIDVLVAKDSGGQETVAKFDAAAARGVPVVVVRRPPPPPGDAPEVTEPEAALAWCAALDLGGASAGPSSMAPPSTGPWVSPAGGACLGR